MQRFLRIRHAPVFALVALGVTACKNDMTSPPPGPRLLSASAAFTLTSAELPGLGGQITRATGINQLGQVIGVATTSTGEQHAVLWIGGVAHDLGTPTPGQSATASDINDQGQVTVWSGGRGYLWDARRYRDLGTLGGAVGGQLALNNPGQVAGWSVAAGGETHAFIWTTSSGMTDLGTLGGTNSLAVDINDHSQVVGSATTATGSQHAVLWEAGTSTDLGTLGSSSFDFSQAIAINGVGQVIGFSYNAAEQSHSFLWASGQPMMDLGGGRYSSARAINDHGQVVGQADVDGADVAFLWDGAMHPLPGLAGGTSSSADAINSQSWAAGWTLLGSGAQNAVLWVDGQPTELPGAGGSFTTATAINDRGEIVGYGNDAGGKGHAFLWRTSSDLDPAQMLAALGDAIGSLAAANALSAGNATDLLASVHAAQAAVERGNSNAAKGELGAFINKVNALIRSNRLSAADGGRLVSAAQSVIDLLGT